MNKNKWLVVALALSMSMGYTSCKKDAPVQTTTEEVASDIKTDVEELMIGVGETSKIEILSGGGTYKVFSENPDILEATLEGNTINIVSKTKGWGGVVISDAKGVYKRISIGSRYNALSLDTEKITDVIKLGNEGSPKAINVIAGNGEYKAVSSDESVVRVNYVREGVISVVATGKGTAKVTITDLMGVTAEVAVEVEVTTKYYTPDEIEVIKGQTGDLFLFNGTNYTTYMKYGRPKFTIADGRTTFAFQQGWGNYQTILDLSYEGDFSVGAKQNGRISFKTAYDSTPTVLETPELEVVQSTEDRVWIVFSQVKDEKLVGGVLIVARPA
ncbi:MAG: hypothetical protein SPK09_08845 [Porphyromonas sp.]|nr:hypothetical protein [Porphyromonas sp.]